MTRVVQLERVDAEATVIAMSGALDRYAAGELRELTELASRSPRRVVIEMSRVTEMPRPVIGVLVGAWHLLEDRLTVRCSDSVQAVLVETGLDRLLPVL